MRFRIGPLSMSSGVAIVLGAVALLGLALCCGVGAGIMALS